MAGVAVAIVVVVAANADGLEHSARSAAGAAETTTMIGILVAVADRMDTYSDKAFFQPVAMDGGDGDDEAAAVGMVRSLDHADVGDGDSIRVVAVSCSESVRRHVDGSYHVRVVRQSANRMVAVDSVETLGLGVAASSKEGRS